MTRRKDALLGCSFCGKSHNEVKKLIAGSNVQICNECVDICNEILFDNVAQNQTAIVKEEAAPTPPISEWLPCPSCGTTLMLTLQLPDNSADAEPPPAHNPKEND